MSRPYSHHRSVSGQGQRSNTLDWALQDATADAKKHQTWASRHHVPRRTVDSVSHERRHSRGTMSDYEDVYESQARRQPNIKKQKFFEDGDYLGQKQRHDTIGRRVPSQEQISRQPRNDVNKPKPRHATFHESTVDPSNKPPRRSQQPSASQAQNHSSSSSHYFKSLSDWRKSVANLLDKSQMSAVDRFRRRTLGFRLAVCIGLILATTAVIAAIMGAVYYARTHRQPLAKPKVHVLASINGTLRLLDMPFRDVLEDHDSIEFKQLESAICATIRDAVTDSTLCSVNKFRNGSVIADFQFKVNLPGMKEVDQKVSMIGAAGLMQNRRREEIMANLTSKKLSKVGHKFNLFIDPEYTRQPGVDLFMTEIRTQKVVRIANVQPVLDNKDVEALCHENSTELLETNYFADRTDCRAFLVCDGALLYRLTCGEGTAWNDEELTCDFKSKLNCTYEDGDMDDGDAELPGKVNAEGKIKTEATTTTTTTTTTTEEATTRKLSEGRRNAQFKLRSTFDENAPPVPKKRPVDDDLDMLDILDEDVPTTTTTTKKAKKTTSEQTKKSTLASLEEIDLEPTTMRSVLLTTKSKKTLSPLAMAAMDAEALDASRTTTEKPKAKSQSPLREAVKVVAEEIVTKKQQTVKPVAEETAPKQAAAKEEKPAKKRLASFAETPRRHPTFELLPKHSHVAFIGSVPDDEDNGDVDYAIAATKARRRAVMFSAPELATDAEH